MKRKAIIWLKIGFIAGAVVDTMALLPMLVPWAAKIFWGFSGFTGIYYFAQGMGASLMLGWTLLLLWAYHKPLERRFILLLTIIVVISMRVSDVIGIYERYVDAVKLLPSFVISLILLFLFGYSYFISGRVVHSLEPESANTL
jgi:hypothetical protein